MNVEEELRELAASLNPPAFFSRIDLWRRGGIAGSSLGDRVSGSRGAKLPAFDRTDIALNEAERQYREHLQGVSVAMSTGDEREARKLLQKALVLEQVWLVPIKTPDAEMVKRLSLLVSDARSCLCSNTRELWERAGRRTPWRIKRGLGPCCYSSWAEAGRPDIGQWLRLNRPSEAQAS